MGTRHTKVSRRDQRARAGTLTPMSSSLSNVFAAAEENARELPMSPYAFGALAMVCFLVLLGVLWAFRGVAQKQAGVHLSHDDEGSTGGSH